MSTTLFFAQLIALLATALFAGAAIYISFVEHPARMECSTELAATVWEPSYRRATLMQAPLAMIGFLCGASAWLLGAHAAWLIGALLILAVVPFTLLIIGPRVNNALMNADLDRKSDEARSLLRKWGRLHAVRSVLGFAATLIFAWQSVRF